MKYFSSRIFVLSGLLFSLLFLQNAAIRKTRKAPDFSLFDNNGKVVRLSRVIHNKKNKEKNIVVLNFFSSWCPKCDVEIKRMVKLNRYYKSRGVKFFGVLTDENIKKSDMSDLIMKYNISYPVLKITSKVLKKYDGVRIVPTTYVINTRQEIIKKYCGKTYDYNIEKVLTTLIKKKSNKKKSKENTFVYNN